MIDPKESKEQFLAQIEGEVDFRNVRAEQHNDLKNIVARDNILSLYEYVEQLSENESLFLLLRTPDYSANEIINDQLRHYGYQDQSSPEEFIKELKSKLATH